MKTQRHHLFLSLTLASVTALSISGRVCAQQADPIFTGSATILQSGASGSGGPGAYAAALFLSDGTFSDHPFGMTLTFFQDNLQSGAFGGIGTFYLNLADTEWRWQTSNSTPMLLESSGRLTLLSPNQTSSTPPAIVLDPDAATITIHGSPVLTGGVASGWGSIAIGDMVDASGSYAFAMGGHTDASGDYSFAFGAGSGAGGYNSSAFGGAYAVGWYSTAFGGANAGGSFSTAFAGSNAYADYSTALGGAVAGGSYSTALGGSTASADYSTALGQASAYGNYSTAFGGSGAYEAYAFASGQQNYASGDSSVAMGRWTTAYGTGSAAFGTGTYAQGLSQFVIGQYNTALGSANSLGATDPLFIIGNGTSSSAKSNALVVKNNGDLVASGTVYSGASPLLTQAAANAAYIPLNPASVSIGGNFTFSSGANRTISVGAGAANGLTLQAGGSASGTNQVGGTLTLSAGTSTGEKGSTIDFRTAAVGASGSQANSTVSRMTINSNGAVGLGSGALSGYTYAGLPGLDVSYGGVPGTMILGAENNLATRTTNTAKVMRVGVAPYSSGALAMAAMTANTLSGSSDLYLGGGTGVMNAATSILFHTALNNTTPTGSLRMRINPNGSIAAGEGSVANASSQFVAGTYNDTSINHTDGVFVIGAGTSTTTRQNALRVLPDGTVLVKGSGDLSMGGFNAGPTP